MIKYSNKEQFKLAGFILIQSCRLLTTIYQRKHGDSNLDQLITCYITYTAKSRKKRILECSLFSFVSSLFLHSYTNQDSCLENSATYGVPGLPKGTNEDKIQQKYP